MFTPLAQAFLTQPASRRSAYFAECGVTAQMVVRAYLVFARFSDSSYETDDGYNSAMSKGMAVQFDGAGEFRNGDHRIQWDSIAAEFHEFVLQSIRNEIATYA